MDNNHSGKAFFSAPNAYARLALVGLLSLLLLTIFSCGTNSPETRVEPPLPPARSVYIAVENSTAEVLSIKLKVGLNDPIQKQHLITKKTDTLLLTLTQERLMTFESKAALAKDLIVKPGDSLFIGIKAGELSVRSSAENAAINKYQSQFVDNESKRQDSLYAKLVTIDSTRALKGFSDYAMHVFYPLSFQKAFYEEHPEVLNDLVSATYGKVNGLLNKINVEVQNSGRLALGVKEEVELNRLFLRISYLARQLKTEDYMEALLESPFFHDEMLMNSIYSETYLSRYITEGVLDGKLKRTANRNYIEYAKAYDLLEKHFEGPVLARAKRLCLERMVFENESYETISTYATAYQKTYPEDSLFFKSFSDNFLMSQKKLVTSKFGLNLLKKDGATKMLTGLLEELKGQVIYVDYWASWCAPCRDAMPSSLLLNEKYQNKGVTFVYFSVDKGQEAWRRASISDKISNYEHSYLVLNHVVSDFRESLQIDAIPRYLIFDKQGKLVEKNAPGPKDKSLEPVLNKYIGN